MNEEPSCAGRGRVEQLRDGGGRGGGGPTPQVRRSLPDGASVRGNGGSEHGECRRRGEGHTTTTVTQQSSSERATRSAEMQRPRHGAEQAASTAPMIVAVDGTPASSMAAAAAVLLACDIHAPVVFVYVRRGPSTVWGSPFYERRLTQALASARAALEPPCMLASDVGVDGEVEILEGSPSRRIAELAAARGAQLVVVGARRRRLRRSVSRRLIAVSNVPVLVTPDEESGRPLDRPSDRPRSALWDASLLRGFVSGERDASDWDPRDRPLGQQAGTRAGCGLRRAAPRGAARGASRLGRGGSGRAARRSGLRSWPSRVRRR